MSKELEGIIVKGIGGFYTVEIEDSPFLSQTVEAKARGKLRYQENKPVVGDRVLLKKEKDTYVIDQILPRKNLFIRPPVSNVDEALLCFSIAQPDINLLPLDKLIVSSKMNHIEPIICITKTDLNQEKAEEVKRVYEKAGFQVFLLSTKKEDDLPELLKQIKNKVAFMAGPSGAGKSTLANRFCQTQMHTGDVSKKLKRGKNTTRHVELLRTKDEGYLLDTPGFSSFEIQDLRPEELRLYYPEFEDNYCRFDNCLHLKEPGCSIKEQIELKEIDKDRYERYKLILEELKEGLPY